MIALLASLGLIFYFLVPGVLFRICFSFFIPLKKFQRTKSEEITFAAVAAVVPLVAAVMLIWQGGWFARHPFVFGSEHAQVAADYKTVFAGVYSEPFFNQNQQAFWQSGARAVRGQVTLLAWYYAFLTFEAVFLGLFARAYGRLHKNRVYGWVAGKILLSSISEWHAMLTPFAFPPKPSRNVMADVLTSDDHLYRGVVANHYVDREGKLSGILLKGVIRFDRVNYLREKAAGSARPISNYWKPIPGQNVYVFAEKIININLAYEVPAPRLIQQIVQNLGIAARVKVAPVDLPSEPSQGR
jgi:hypothetical protein